MATKKSNKQLWIMLALIAAIAAAILLLPDGSRPDSAPADVEIWKQRLLTLAPTVIGSETAREFLQGIGHAVTGNH